MEISIENAEEYIPSKKTREYFKEVVSSYVNGNYRSAIVMLYSVVICDLIYKMIDLRDIYQDEKATKILEDIKNQQQNDPNSPDWEKKLLERIKNEMDLLSYIEYDRIVELKKNRNLSAHPALKNQYELYTPTKQMTIALIHEMLNAVLIKPALLSKKIMNVFLEDISKEKDTFKNLENQYDEEAFCVFLKTRYFKHMSKTRLKEFFKALWKFVFMLNDDNDCNANRDINFVALSCFYKTYRDELLNYIKQTQEYFLVSEAYINLLFDYLIKYPEIFDNLQDDIKVMLKKNYDNNNIHARILGVFISETLEKHCEMLSEIDFNQYEISTIKKDIISLYDYAFSVNKGFLILKCYIQIFRKSNSFMKAEENFNLFVKPYLEFMEESELKILLESIKRNPQIYECWAIKGEYGYINNYMRKYLGENFSIADEIRNRD